MAKKRKFPVPERELTDKLLEYAAYFACVFMIYELVAEYSVLPDRVPTKYNFSGEAVAYGGKGTLLILPIIAGLVCVGFSFLSRYPNSYNYNVKITEENAERQFRLAIRMILSLNAIIAIGFAFINHFTIGSAAGQNNENAILWLMPIFLISLFGLIGYYFVAAKKNK